MSRKTGLLNKNISTGLTNLLSQIENLKSKIINLQLPNNKISRDEIPVSVKTRIGYDAPITESWIGNLDKAKPDWIAVHGRTLKQMYCGKADWDEIAKAVQSISSPVLANGDVNTPEDAIKILEVTKAAGTLIGRASFGKRKN